MAETPVGWIKEVLGLRRFISQTQGWHGRTGIERQSDIALVTHTPLTALDGTGGSIRVQGKNLS